MKSFDAFVDGAVLRNCLPLNILHGLCLPGRMAWAGTARHTAIVMTQIVHRRNAKSGNQWRPDTQRVTRECALGWGWRLVWNIEMSGDRHRQCRSGLSTYTDLFKNAYVANTKLLSPRCHRSILPRIRTCSLVLRAMEHLAGASSVFSAVVPFSIIPDQPVVICAMLDIRRPVRTIQGDRSQFQEANTIRTGFRVGYFPTAYFVAFR
jgi:hypothetical protein